MEHQERLEMLMTELGPTSDLEGVSYFPDSNLWMVARDDLTVIEAEFHPVSGRLLLAADIAPTPEGAGRAFYEMLLQYNLLWRDTGGLVLALDGKEGQVVLQYSCAVDALDLESLRGNVESLFRQIDLWREVISNAAESIDESEGGEVISSADIGFMQGIIRG